MNVQLTDVCIRGSPDGKVNLPYGTFPACHNLTCVCVHCGAAQDTDSVVNSLEAGLGMLIHFIFIALYLLVWGVNIVQVSQVELDVYHLQDSSACDIPCVGACVTK